MKKKTKSAKEEPKDPRIEAEYWTEITYTCPKRGKVTEKVKVKKIKTIEPPPTINDHDAEIIREILGSEDEEI